MNDERVSGVILSDPYISTPLAFDLGVGPSNGPQDADGLSTATELHGQKPALSNELIEAFMHRFSSTQFLFLDPDQFQSSLQLLSLFPSSLFYVVYLWAIHISPETADPFFGSEEQAVSSAVACIANEISTIQSPDLYIIQTEVLLSLYFLETGRYIEGKYHCSVATSLALSFNLHQLRTPSYISNFSLWFSTTTAPSVWGISSREHVKAFWSVVILNNYWVATLGTPSSITPDTLIHTPWPTDNFDLVSLAYNSLGVDEDPSCFSFLLEASRLYQESFTFNERDPGLPHPSEFWALENRLATFRDQLPPPNLTASGIQQCLVSHIFANAAILRLCFMHIETCHLSQLKYWDHVDPILGPLLFSFAKFGITRLQFASPTEIENLHTILTAMRILSSHSRLIEKCYTLILQDYETVNAGLSVIHSS